MSTTAGKASEPCSHCWHQWGCASGGFTPTTSTARGTNRCCHCGEFQSYDYTLASVPEPRHGRFHPEILRWPA